VSTPGNVQAERYQLFQRTGSTRWQVRFSIKGQGQFKRSLDTDDEREAERRAEAIWYEATYRAKQGLIPIGGDYNRYAHWRSPRDMMIQGCATSLFQASQH